MRAPSATSATSIVKDPIRKLEEWSRDFVNWLEDWVSSFSAADWVFVTLGLAALFWIGASLRAMTRLGPIEVATLEHDGETVTVKALTGALREQLAANGLSPPPAVPSGTPQVDLIAAVEATAGPQSAFIAKLIQLLPKPPRPPRYEITGVLTGEQKEDDTAMQSRPKTQGPCGLMFWIRPSREGEALLDSVKDCQSHEEAVRRAAFAIYKHVSNDAIHAFPLWARWRKAKSLKAYLGACRPCPPGDPREAIRQLDTAMSAEPFNALAPLQRANLYEGLVPSDYPLDRASAQSSALRSYLEIANDWPALVQARYRASVLAGALATTVEVGFSANKPFSEGDKQAICFLLSLEGVTPESLAPRLRDLAARESKAVLQLLKPWYAVVRERRLRNQFEPKSHRRREVKRTVAISKHCVQMRALCGESLFWARCRMRYSELAVRVGHMLFGRGAISWQAHYNAACFHALLLQHLRTVAGRPRPAAPGSYREQLKTALEWARERFLRALGRVGGAPRRADRVRERALRSLDTAVREADDQLAPAWVERDPDFQVFAAQDGAPADAAWDKLVKRIQRAATPSPERQELEEVELEAPEPVAPPPLIAIPPRPWGDPARRVMRWWVVGLVAGLISPLLFALTGNGAWLLVGAPVVAVAVWRALWASWEARLTRATDVQQPAEVPWKVPEKSATAPP